MASTPTSGDQGAASDECKNVSNTWLTLPKPSFQSHRSSSCRSHYVPPPSHIFPFLSLTSPASTDLLPFGTRLFETSATLVPTGVSSRQVTKEYLEEIWKLFTNLAGAISEGLGLEKGKIVESLGEGTQIIVAKYYPPCPQPELTLGLAAHSDHGALTILMDNNVEGLEVRHNQMWVQVPHIPATFVCNIGDYLEILSNGKYRSVEHRAVVNKKRRRISIGVGHGPELSSIVAPAAQLADEDGGPKYKPVTYADYMKHQQCIVSRGKTALEPVKIDTI